MVFQSVFFSFELGPRVMTRVTTHELANRPFLVEIERLESFVMSFL